MAKRLSLTLERDDEAKVAAFAQEGTPEREALLVWAATRGMDPDRLRSEASMLRLLVRAGVESLVEQALDAGYAELAESRTPEENAESREARRRYLTRSEFPSDT
jgi:hypothetical protein